MSRHPIVFAATASLFLGLLIGQLASLRSRCEYIESHLDGCQPCVNVDALNNHLIALEAEIYSLDRTMQSTR